MTIYINHISRHLQLLLVVLVSMLPLHALPHDFQPIITNYTSMQYMGGLQNWSVTQGSDGLIYVGNNSGVLSFDGYNWDLTSLPGNIIARSIYCDGNRLYVGGYEEFGYMERKNYGQLEFHSLWQQLQDYKPHNDEVWNIVKTRDGHILFQTFCSWFDYDGKHVKAHYNPRTPPLYFFSVDGEIYAQIMNGDFCKLEGDKFKTVITRSRLNDNVVATLTLQDGNMLLCTERCGLMLYKSSNEFTPWPCAVDNELRAKLINRATISRDKSTIAVGTILGGVYGLDLHGNIKWQYNTSNQLVNNSILALYFDSENNVWVGSDTGLSLIHTGAPFTLLGNTAMQLGMVYDVLPSPRGLYIATNQRTFLYSQRQLQPVAGTEEQNWHLTSVGDDIIVGNNRGSRIIDNTTSRPYGDGTSSSSTAMRGYSINNDENYLIESSYVDLRVYKSEAHSWTPLGPLKDFQAPVQQFEVDRDGIIWAAHMSKGLYRIVPSRNMLGIDSIKYYPSLSGTEHGSHIHIFKIRGDIVLSEGDKLYHIKNGHEFEEFHELAPLIHNQVLSATTVDNHRFWLTLPSGYMLIEHTGNKYHVKEKIRSAFFGLECSDVSNNVVVSNGKTYFCLNGGVACLDNDFYANARNDAMAKLNIAWAKYVTSDGEHHFLPIDGSTAIARGDVMIRVTYPNFDNRGVTFRYTINGSSHKQQIETTSPELTLNSLKYGRYTLRIEVVDGNGTVLDTVNYTFAYPRPPLLSIPAIALYIVLLVLTVFYLTKLYDQRKQRQLQQQLEKQNMEQKLVQAEQQQQILERQIKDKGKEIASMAMDGIISRQKVDEIKQEMQRQRKMSPQDLQRVFSMLDATSSKDAWWDVYKENFDLIHANFFRNLRKLYPSLTASDLKFCALIRLNLNTKDIAQVTGLTVRGVEGARYRLRKKLGVDKDQSLTEFLIDFSGNQDDTNDTPTTEGN